MEMIIKYFNAERAESLLFIGTGIVAIITGACFLLLQNRPFFKGMAYPLITIAIIQIAVGSIVFLRSPKDIERVNRIIADDKNGIATEEIPRMETVMNGFALYKKIEIGLIITGILMFLFLNHESAIRGAGLGLFTQALFMLILDFFAEHRGMEYLNFLRGL